MSIARASASPSKSARFRALSVERLCGWSAVITGALAWAFYSRADLVLSHYDAKAHLVVARRVFDNLTPGWQQFGAVWLPLPHLLLVVPVQNDFLYRTGLAGSFISVICLGITAWAMASFVLRVTGSSIGGITAATLVTLNPSLLYLYATPMTEPLLLAVTSLLLLWLYDWVQADQDRLPPRLGWLLAAAAWTRYEAWAVIAVAGALTLVVLLFQRIPPVRLAARARSFAVWPLAAALLFLIDSRITVGQWFVSGGFYVPDPKYAGQLGATLVAIAEGARDLSGYALLTAAIGGVTLAGWTGLRDKARSTTWIGLALFACGLLPLVAFYDGHPFRIRYMVPLVAAAALWSGVGIGLLPQRLRGIVAALVIALAIFEAPPLSVQAPMVTEAQLDRPAGRARTLVSSCLDKDYRGDKILMSMGSLAHYMQELSWHGLTLRDFVHEGNGIIWEVALETGPAAHAGWMLVEEIAEGGDVLARRIRDDPSFLRGMRPVCSSGGVTLYQRTARGSQRPPD